MASYTLIKATGTLYALVYVPHVAAYPKTSCPATQHGNVRPRIYRRAAAKCNSTKTMAMLLFLLSP